MRGGPVYEQLPEFIRNPDPAVYLRDNYVVLDVETTNTEHGSALAANHLLLACWRLGKNHPSRGSGRDHYQWGDEFNQQSLIEHIYQADYLVAHNTKFELGWLKRCGLDLRRVLPACTMIGEKVLAGNRKVELSLAATAERRGLGAKASFVSSCIKAGVCPSQIPHASLLEYCAQDVALSESIFLEQRKELAALDLLPVFYCRNLVTPALADIEFNGMTLDPERVAETYAEYAEKYASLEKEFYRLTGGINPKSPKQLAEFIYGTLRFSELTDHRGNVEKTGAGSPKTDKHTLAKLEAQTEEQKEFLKVAKELVKLKTPLQNLTKMMAICKEHPNDPRMYFTFNQANTDTDRLSSTGRRGGLQGQNIERAFKRLFLAGSEGSVISESDGGQLEFRISVHLGRDRQGLADILSRLDVHQVSADYHGGSRQDGKARTFRPLFGGKSGTPRERRYIKYFVERYSGVSATQSSWAFSAARDKFITTETGYRFYFPDAKITQSGYVTGTTKIYNYPIQQLATGDIIPLCLAAIWHRSGALGDACVVRNTIHDSIVSEVSSNRLSEYNSIVVDVFTVWIYEMLEKLYGIKLTVPLAVGLKAGKHWSEGEEEKHEAQAFFDM
jgi:DNA polymerase I-like protein with 3'-5' exonuclease and polymerase domains